MDQMLSGLFSLLFYAFLLFCAFSILGSSIKIVRQQTVQIVETLGKYSDTLEPGLNFILPFPFSRVVKVLDLRIQEIKKGIEVKTSDNMFVGIPVTIMYQVDEDRAAEAFYKLDDPAVQVERWVLNTIRAKAADMTLEELFKDRSMIADEVTAALAVKLKEFGFIINTTLIDQPTVPEDVQHAFNRVIASRREKEAAEQEAAANKIRTLANAQAEAEAQIERAKGLGVARETIAKSYASSMDIIKNSGGDPKQAMDLLLAVNRLDALREIGSHKNLVIVDLNQNEGGSTDQAILPLLAKQFKVMHEKSKPDVFQE